VGADGRQRGRGRAPGPPDLPDLGAFIAERGRRTEFGAGEYLFHEGDRSVAVYACLDGRVGIELALPSGRELLLGMKTPGQAFGELSAIDHGSRSASARAVDDVAVAVLGVEAFLSGLAERPDLAIGMLRDMAGLLRASNARLSARNSESIAARVGGRLLELSHLTRRHAGTIGSVELPITQTDLANWVGTTRESAARALSSLREAGAVRTGRGVIVVVDINLLEVAVRTGCG